jgi:thiamine-monophosphate kinase
MLRELAEKTGNTARRVEAAILGTVPLHEKALIQRIRRAAGSGAGRVRLGIGDDAAILHIPAGQEVLVTTDFTLEGVHFRREWHPAESVGHRCLARGLSDIAAMGGEPMAAFLSLALPPELPQRWVDGFVRGLLRLARQHRVTLAGGDTAGSPGGSGVLADMVVVGTAPAGKALRRSGARPGDLLYVTGELGGSAVALGMFFAGKKASTQAHRRHFFPEPRVGIGQVLRGMATAMIDLSDGLSTDLHHICQESGVGAVVEAAAVPRARSASLEQALHGGEDYELLFTAQPSRRIPERIAGVRVTRIGEITRRGVVLAQAGRREKLVARGWEHLRS